MSFRGNHILIALLVFGLSHLALIAQDISTPQTKHAPSPQPPLVHIKLTDDSKVSLPYPDTTPTFLKQCDQAGNVYSSMLGSNGLEIVGFTSDGIRELSTSTITDIPEASINRFFASDSGLQVLAIGIENVKKKTITDTVAGTDEKVQRVKTEGRRVYYIARFGWDGAYKSAVKLEIPRFQPYQIGAFQSGNYLIAGVEDNTVPRLFIVNSSGQPLKILELPGDITEKSKALKNVFGEKNDSGQASVDVAAMFANILAYQDKLLFVRSGISPIVYEIRDSGEIRAVKLHLPSGYNIDTMLASDKNWMVEVRKGPLVQATKTESEGHGDIERTFLEIDPQNGEALRQFRVSGPKDSVGVPAMDLSCWHEGQFIGLHQKDGKVTLIRGDVETTP